MTTLKDDLKSLQTSLGRPSEGLTNTPGSTEWLSMALKSGGASLGEWIGIDPSYAVERWRTQNPVASGVVGLGVTMVPYVGWAGATRKAGWLAKAMDAAGTAEKVGVLGAAGREAIRWAPLEAGRLATAAAVGDKPLSDTLWDSAVSLGLGGAIGGGAQFLRNFGRQTAALRDLIPGFDETLPVTLQLRKVQGIAENEALSPEVKNRLTGAITRMRSIVREDLTDGSYVGNLPSGASRRAVDRLFRVNFEPSTQLRRQRFITTNNPEIGFPSREAWETEAKKIFGRADFEADVQYPRLNTALQAKGAFFLQTAVDKNLARISSNTWVQRETNNGLYVFARKIEGAPNKAAAGDKWAIWKTDRPGVFMPEYERFKNVMTDASRWYTPPATRAKTGLQLIDEATRLKKILPYENYLAMVKPGASTGSLMRGIGKTLGMDDAVGEGATTAMRGLKNFVNEYVAPLQFQFKTPLGRYAMTQAKLIYSAAERQAQELMFGKLQLGKEGSLVGQVFKGATKLDENSLKAELEKLSDADRFGLWKLWTNGIGPDMGEELLARGEITEQALKFARTLDKVDGYMLDQIMRTQKLVGVPEMVPLKNHYLISHTWRGKLRTPIFNEANELIYVASGKTAKESQREADAILSKLGEGFHLGETRVYDRDMEKILLLPGELAMLKLGHPDYVKASAAHEALFRTAPRPGFMKDRAGIGGYVGQESPWDKAELEEILSNHLNSQWKYMARLTTDHAINAERNQLIAIAPGEARILEARLKDLAGESGPFGKVTNAVVDKLLAPALGPNSATKIVQTTNQAMFHLQFGAGQLVQPILNVLGTLQTVLPEIAAVLGPVPKRMAGSYGVHPVLDSAGRLKATVSVLSPMKIFGRAMQELRHPDAALRAGFEKAAHAGDLSPRIFEEYVGESATKVSQWREAFQSPKQFAQWTSEVSQFLPKETEKLGRSLAFVSGWITGRDMLGLTGDSLYHFAKELTYRTMYGYATVDRSRMFTTPLGSTFGLFKNWIMNYMFNMARYGGMAMEGNWAPLLWQTAATSAIGGLAAQPFYGVANGLSKLITDKSLMTTMYDGFAGADGEDSGFADGLMFGLPAFLGVALTGNASSPGANPLRDIEMLTSLVQMDRGRMLGKAIGEGISVWQATGNNPLESEKVRGLVIRAVAPKTVQRVAGSYEDAAIKSLVTNNPNLLEASIGERAAFMVGFNPLGLEKQYRVADELYNSQRWQKEQVAAAGQALLEARGDAEESGRILQIAIAKGLDVSSVLASYHSREADANQDLLERKFSAADIYRMRNVLNR